MYIDVIFKHLSLFLHFRWISLKLSTAVSQYSHSHKQHLERI